MTDATASRQKTDQKACNGRAVIAAAARGAFRSCARVVACFVAIADCRRTRCAPSTPSPTSRGCARSSTTLASPEFAGRSGAGGEKAAAYLVDRFRALKLEPLFEGEFRQAVPGKEPGIDHRAQRRRAAAAAAIPSSRTNGSSWRRISITWGCATAGSTRAPTTMPRASR